MSADFCRPQLLRASAGTGKTYQLVRLYADLILRDGLRPAQVVAITFTRKAIGELSARIRQHLRAAGADAELLAELQAAAPVNFHGLCLRLWAELQPQDDAPLHVLGEADEDRALFLEACEMAWMHGASSLPTAEVAAACQQVAPHFALHDALPDDLWQAISRAREDGRPIDAALFARCDPSAAVDAAHAAVAALQAELQGQLGELQRKPLKKDAALRDRLSSFVAAARDALANFAAAPTAAADACATALHALGRRGRLATWLPEERALQLKEALDAVPAEALCAALRPALISLAAAAWEQYGRLKTTRGTVDFADIVERTVHHLEQDATARALLAGRLRAVLVDEAQDTNPLQRRLVYLLAGMAAEGVASARLVVVGDAKQAIYSFRGADPQSFAAFAEAIARRDGSQIELQTSYRSSAALLDGINHLGEHLFEAAYEPLLPPADRSFAAAPGGALQWLVAANPQADAGSDAEVEAQRLTAAVQRHLKNGGSAGDVAVLISSMAHAPLFAQTLRRHGIDAVITSGGNLFDQPEVADVLALLRWCVDATAHLAAACALRAPLFGLSDGALWLLLRDGAAGLAALRSGTVAPPVLAALAAPWAADELEAVQRAAAALAVLQPLAARGGAAATLRCVDAMLDWRALYQRDLDATSQVAVNVDSLCDLAARSDGRHGSTAAFVRHLEARRQRGSEPLPQAATPAQRDYVTLSSVHQSKGLQYPVVILPCLARKGRNETACLLYHADHGIALRPQGVPRAGKGLAYAAASAAAAAAAAAELRRLLYVAMTRAEAQLLLIAPPQRAGKGIEDLPGSFGKLVGPWVAAARAAGVLQEQALAPPQLPAAAAPSAALEVAEPSPLPAGSWATFSVTEVAKSAAVDAAPSAAPSASAAQRAEGAVLRQRGELAHAVLALAGELATPSPEAFVDAALQRLQQPGDGAPPAGLRDDLLYFLKSPLGQRMVAAPVALRRHEMPFVCGCPAPPHRALLRGQMDLLIWDEGRLLVVDFKYAHRRDAALPPYLLQLDAYAWAAGQLCGLDADIASTLVFLRDRSPPLHHLATRDRQAEIPRRLQALSSAAVAAAAGAA